MLKAGLQFIFVILFARNCYLAPFHLDPVVKEALTDLLTAAASHVIFGDADANDLGKRQMQSTNAVRGNYSHSTVIMPLFRVYLRTKYLCLARATHCSRGVWDKQFLWNHLKI